jgi:hypothetical protein
MSTSPFRLDWNVVSEAAGLLSDGAELESTSGRQTH